ncbi:MAG: DMT family transporter [Desulfovibrionaceae bacterium]|nr:DMT family transporter [Desulfovibrionaceae bacterium]
MRLFVLAALAMCLFSANGLLCRMALTQTGMDAASFTILRVVSGAVMLFALTARRRGKTFSIGGNFKAAAALFTYMLCFSFAYRGLLTAATGTLIIGAAIVLTALVISRIMGDAIGRQQLVGIAITFGGVILLVTPSLARPSPLDALLMACAGAAFVIYSTLGRKSTDPLSDMAGIFLRCLPFTVLLLPFVKEMPLQGTLYAIASGALASGLGYALWYRLVGILSTLTAALIQLSVPVFSALGGWLLLNEAITLRLVISGIIIIGGIAYTHMHPAWKQ